MWCYDEENVREALTEEEFTIISLLLDKVDIYMWQKEQSEKGDY